jgi:hypothetical protein
MPASDYVHGTQEDMLEQIAIQSNLVPDIFIRKTAMKLREVYEAAEQCNLSKLLNSYVVFANIMELCNDAAKATGGVSKPFTDKLGEYVFDEIVGALNKKCSCKLET